MNGDAKIDATNGFDGTYYSLRRAEFISVTVLSLRERVERSLKTHYEYTLSEQIRIIVQRICIIVQRIHIIRSANMHHF